MNFYKILRVKPNANEQEIKNAVYRMKKIWNPEEFEKYKIVAQKVFEDIQSAEMVLTNHVNRCIYDKNINQDHITRKESAEGLIRTGSGTSIHYERPWIARGNSRSNKRYSDCRTNYSRSRENRASSDRRLYENSNLNGYENKLECQPDKDSELQDFSSSDKSISRTRISAQNNFNDSRFEEMLIERVEHGIKLPKSSEEFLLKNIEPISLHDAQITYAEENRIPEKSISYDSVMKTPPQKKILFSSLSLEKINTFSTLSDRGKNRCNQKEIFKGNTEDNSQKHTNVDKVEDNLVGKRVSDAFHETVVKVPAIGCTLSRENISAYGFSSITNSLSKETLVMPQQSDDDLTLSNIPNAPSKKFHSDYKVPTKEHPKGSRSFSDLGLHRSYTENNQRPNSKNDVNSKYKYIEFENMSRDSINDMNRNQNTHQIKSSKSLHEIADPTIYSNNKGTCEGINMDIDVKAMDFNTEENGEFNNSSSSKYYDASNNSCRIKSENSRKNEESYRGTYDENKKVSEKHINSYQQIKEFRENRQQPSASSTSLKNKNNFSPESEDIQNLSQFSTDILYNRKFDQDIHKATLEQIFDSESVESGLKGSFDKFAKSNGSFKRLKGGCGSDLTGIDSIKTLKEECGNDKDSTASTKDIDGMKDCQTRNSRNLQDITSVTIRNTKATEVKEDCTLICDSFLELCTRRDIDVSQLKAKATTTYSEDLEWKKITSTSTLKFLEMVTFYKFRDSEELLEISLEGQVVCTLVNGVPEDITTGYSELCEDTHVPLTMTTRMKVNGVILEVVRTREMNSDTIEVLKNGVLLYKLENQIDL